MPSPTRVDDLIRRLGDSGGPRFIRAYHGSPYDFDRFDASKIGTGLGRRAFGHGLYFAENESVAKTYKKAKGKLYRVEIGHPLSRLLDYDSPLAGQPRMATVMSAISQRLPPGDRGLYSDFLRDGPDGGMAYHFLDHLMGPQETATAMQELGVPGLRTLDHTGKGVYVMFPGTEDSIRILRKYGLLAPIAAGALQEDK